MNYWLWLYLVLIPAVVFSATPHTSSWWRVGRLPVAIAICYICINLAVQLKWGLLSAHVNAMPNPTMEDFQRATADGANIIFTLLLGWIPAMVYVGWWEAIWRLAYRKALSQHVIRTRLSSAVVIFSMLVSSALFAFLSIELKWPLNITVFFHLLVPESTRNIAI